MPETAYKVVPLSRRFRGFSGENKVDIVGVTGSIPVTPTIRQPYFSGHLAHNTLHAAYFSLGSMNLGLSAFAPVHGRTR